MTVQASFSQLSSRSSFFGCVKQTDSGSKMLKTGKLNQIFDIFGIYDDKIMDS